MKTERHPKERKASGERSPEPFPTERALIEWTERHGKSSPQSFHAHIPTRGDLLPPWQREDFFRKKRNIVVAAAALLLLAVTIPLFCYLVASGTFRAPPRVPDHDDLQFSHTIHVAADRYYEPFSYIADDGTVQGLDVELIYEVGRRLKCNVDLELFDWNEARTKLSNREVDLILNMELQAINADPALTATIPTAEKQYVVYSRKDDPVKSLSELYGKKKIASLQMFPELRLGDRLVRVDNYPEMFRGLKAKKFECVLCPIQVGAFFLKDLDMMNAGIRPGFAVNHMYSCMALTPENDWLRERIDEALKELHQEGFITALDQKWISHRYERITFSALLSYPAIAILMGVTAAMFVLLLSYMLIQRRRILEKDAYTQELQRYYALVNQQNAQLQQQQQELKEEKARTEAASAAKTRFLANMSHDIRTPMNAVLGFTHLALENLEYRESVRDYLNKIMTAGNNLMGMINDILEMSQIEGGRLKLETEPYSMNRLLRDVYTIVQVQAAEKGVKFSASTSGLRQERVYCDRLRMNQALINVLNNAVKFTPEGGTITLTLSQKPTASRDNYGAYEFRVKDSGIGIGVDFRERIFQPFERERNTTVSAIPGAGLGLSITKNLLDIMGGSIRVESEEGKGSEFIIDVEFPLQEDQQIEVIDDKTILDKTFHKREPGATSGAFENLSGFRILLADDNAVNREIAVTILKMCEASVDTADDGSVAVEKVSASPPGTYDLILMDLQMPRMDGFEAARAIRALPDPAKATIPIVAMSANSFEEDRQEAVRAGMNDHLGKPIDLEKFVSVLQRFYRQRRGDALSSDDPTPAT